jgi:hypothetical protein
MRELHAVTGAVADISKLKAQSLLFDAIHVVELEAQLAGQSAYFDSVGEARPVKIDEYEYLESTGFLVNVAGEPDPEPTLPEPAIGEPAVPEIGDTESGVPEVSETDIGMAVIGELLSLGFILDVEVQRRVIALTSQGLNAVFLAESHMARLIEAIAPWQGLNTEFLKSIETIAQGSKLTPNPLSNRLEPQNGALFSIALNTLPTPGEEASWQDIFEFKKENHDKQWAFRRFLHNMATKKLTAAEISDEIEWSLNEYSKAMELHRIRAAQSFVDVFVISPLEFAENLVKFNWSKIAKGILSVKKRQAEVREAELKAPGCECAYLFDAKRRFRR